MSIPADSLPPAPFTRGELAELAEALDSHLYWQVCQDRTRRRDGQVMEPYTQEEQAVVDLMVRVDAIAATTQNE